MGTPLLAPRARDIEFATRDSFRAIFSGKVARCVRSTQRWANRNRQRSGRPETGSLLKYGRQI
jgi:hypothetical protein